MPGLLEILIIAAVALVVFGHKRIPSLGKSLGVGAGEFGKSFKEAASLPDSQAVSEKKDGETEPQRTQ